MDEERPLQDSSDVQCIIAVSGYVCANVSTLKAVYTACFVCTIITLLIATFVLVFRMRHRLITALYRRIDDYWMPLPVDVLVVGWFLEKLLRTIAFTILFIDWQRDGLAYEVVYLLATATVRITLVQFTIGIISHIPPAFSQKICTHERNRNRSRARIATQDSSPTVMTPTTKAFMQHNKYVLYVPPFRALYWFNVTYTTIWILFTLVSGVMVTYGGAANEPVFRFNSNRILSIASLLNYALILAVSSYYCYGFYRIIRSHTISSTKSYDVKEKEKKVASNFRKIFLAVLALPLFNIIGTTVRHILSHFPEIKQRVQIGDLIMHQIIVYCFIEWIIYAFIFRSSRNQLKSRGGSRTVSNVPSNNVSNIGGNNGSKLQVNTGSAHMTSSGQGGSPTSAAATEGHRRDYYTYTGNGDALSRAPSSPA
ncbi:hypothetical protein BDF22DRAFT_703501 [Syncephalis plumigaleata]|nr:hypothetical protein BDF22DRAFT_703501 [Syncephalis plumigaleata]